MNGIDKTVMEELAPLLADSMVQSGSFDHWIQEPGKWNELVDGTFCGCFSNFTYAAWAPAPMPALPVAKPSNLVSRRLQHFCST